MKKQFTLFAIIGVALLVIIQLFNIVQYYEYYDAYGVITNALSIIGHILLLVFFIHLFRNQKQ